MNKLSAGALLTAAACAATPGFARDFVGGELGYVPPVHATPSTVTRAAVRAEYLQALRNDTLPASGEGADVGLASTARSTLTRAEVRAQAVLAVRQGEQVGGEI